MTPEARERRAVRRPLLAVSALAWVLLAAAAGGVAFPALCAGMALAAVPAPAAPTPAAIDLALAMNPPATLAIGWALMLAAMMLPLLAAPIRHVRARSLARRRTRAVSLFVVGYAILWMTAGSALVAVALVLRLALPGSVVPLVGALLVAALWQVSPLKQRCLNRCHALPGLAAFGLAADRDAFGFGVRQAVWCIGACWALMLLPLLVAQGHMLAMAVVALWLAGERIETPVRPAWALRWPEKAARLVHARAATHLHFARGDLT